MHKTFIGGYSALQETLKNAVEDANGNIISGYPVIDGSIKITGIIHAYNFKFYKLALLDILIYLIYNYRLTFASEVLENLDKMFHRHV